MSSFPRAAIIKYHKLGGLKVQKFGTYLVVKSPPSSAADTGSNPGWGTTTCYRVQACMQ